MFHMRFCSVIAGAVLSTATLVALPATSASLMSSAVAVEHQFIPFGQGQIIDGLYTLSTTTSLAIPQFDSIFGELTEVRLHIDTTFDFEFPFVRGTSSSEPIIESFLYDYRSRVKIDGTDASFTQFLGHPFFNMGGATSAVSGTITSFDRDVSTLILGPEGWSGTGARTIDVRSEQSVDFRFTDQKLRYAGISNISPTEIVSAVAVEYVFNPGVQTLETTVGLLTFSSALRPEVVLSKNNATVVPLPSSIVGLTGAVLALGMVARRRR